VSAAGREYRHAGQPTRPTPNPRTKGCRRSAAATWRISRAQTLRSRPIRPWPPRSEMTTLERLGRWALAVLPWALLLACLGGGAELGLLGPLEASGQVQRPNVLVIVVDDQTSASLPVMPALSNDATRTRLRARSV